MNLKTFFEVCCFFFQGHKTDFVGVREQLLITVLHRILAGRRENDNESTDDATDCVSGEYKKKQQNSIFVM